MICFHFHCLSRKSAKTKAAQRTQHIQRRSESPPLKHCILEEGADYAFRNKGSQNQVPQKGKALAVGLTTVAWIYNWVYDFIQMPKLGYLPVIIFVSLYALQIVDHMLK